jgi:hypothetical protein
MSKRVFPALAVCLATCALVAGCFLFANRPPVAGVVVRYNVDETDPMVVELDASTSTDPDGDAIVAYSWIFSDNLTVITPSAFTTTVNYPRLRVRCPLEGQYTATVVVRDERGSSSEPLNGILVTVPQPLP